MSVSERLFAKPKDRKVVIIIGAAGRDFHNFNCYFRHNKLYNVCCFTAEQIPGIDSRTYPPVLAGEDLYPQGIPIFPEHDLADLIKKYDADECILAYSDLNHLTVMDKASTVLALGCDFKLMGPKFTMLRSTKPVVAVTAVRTGVGKSQTTRAVIAELKKNGKKAVAIRHPMPYGDLAEQAC
jgi:predicted GTPase